MMMSMMEMMTTMIDTIVNMQEAVLVLCTAEEGEEKKQKLKEYMGKITKQIKNK